MERYKGCGVGSIDSPLGAAPAAAVSAKCDPPPPLHYTTAMNKRVSIAFCKCLRIYKILQETSRFKEFKNKTVKNV